MSFGIILVITFVFTIVRGRYYGTDSKSTTTKEKYF